MVRLTRPATLAADWRCYIYRIVPPSNGAKGKRIMDSFTGLTPQPAPKAGQTVSIVDADQTSFVREVIEASRTVPVLVDFWATWCGPCKTLTPTLEKVVTAAAGRVKLVKIDVDKNRALVEQLARMGLPMQSIPTVAAFWQGQIADLFQGALPESEVKRFVEQLLKLAGGAMPAAELLAEGQALLAQGDPQEAAAVFSEVLGAEPENPGAWGGLVRALIALGQLEDAASALEQVPAKIAEHAEVSGARSALALAQEGQNAAAGLAGLERRAAADPDDFEARYELATALNAVGERDRAAAALLDIVKRNRAWNDDAARLQLLKFFEAWGFADPATLAARRKLSALLFS